jgi:hypothetical protein
MVPVNVFAFPLLIAALCGCKRPVKRLDSGLYFDDDWQRLGNCEQGLMPVETSYIDKSCGLGMAIEDS